MFGISYFNHKKRKVSKISAGGCLRKNNQALSYLSSEVESETELEIEKETTQNQTFLTC